MAASRLLDDSVVMMGDPGSDFGATPASIYLYVVDSDALYQRALESGATSVMEPADQF